MKAWNSTLKRGRSALKRTAMKRSARRKKKIAGYHDNRFLEACRGEPCYLRVPGVCMGAAGKDTVVPVHSNQLKHGKGRGIKAKDKFTVPGCMTCHAWLDQGPALKCLKRRVWDQAYKLWQPIRDGASI